MCSLTCIHVCTFNQNLMDVVVDDKRLPDKTEMRQTNLAECELTTKHVARARRGRAQAAVSQEKSKTKRSVCVDNVTKR